MLLIVVNSWGEGRESRGCRGEAGQRADEKEKIRRPGWEYITRTGKEGRARCVSHLRLFTTINHWYTS